jgi:hypothetical protein
VSGSLTPGDAVATWEGDSSAAGAGYDIAGGADLTGDGRPDLVIGAPNDTSYVNYGGATYVVSDASGGGLSGAEVRILGNPTGECRREYLGRSVTPVGDVNGDGATDLAVGGSWYCGPDDGAYALGAVHVYLGPLTGDLLSDDHDTYVYGNNGTTQSYWLGNMPGSLDTSGDVDGDGLDDLLLGNDAAYADVWQYTGEAYLVTAASLNAGPVDIFFADWTLSGTESQQRVGLAVAGAGAEDGDGFRDVLVGAPQDASYGDHAGAAWLFHGPLSGHQEGADADARFYGEDTFQGVGSTLAGGTDLSGDGWPDFVIGAPERDSTATYSGSVFVLAGGGF